MKSYTFRRVGIYPDFSIIALKSNKSICWKCSFYSLNYKSIIVQEIMQMVLNFLVK